MLSLPAVALFAATSLGELITWVTANWGTIAVTLGVVIGGASVAIKGLEALVAMLLTVFPGLKTVDGELKHIAAWLDALSKSKFLNTMALSPKKDDDPVPTPPPAGPPPAAKATVLLLLAAALLAPSPAHAALDWSIGPTIPFIQVDLDHNVQTSLAPGVGPQISLTEDSLKKEFFGKSWDLLDLDLMAFGSLVHSPSGQQFGQFSVAGAVCTLSSLFCFGAGSHLLSSTGQVHGGAFLVVALSFNFAGSPSSPPTGVEHGPAGLVRGNTLYFGAP